MGTGLFDHMTWHCWGLGDYMSGVGHSHGDCIGTDPGGDQIALSVAEDKHSLGQRA